MDLENQKRVKDAADQYGAENVMVLIGASEAEAAGLAAETVTAGDQPATASGFIRGRRGNGFWRRPGPDNRPWRISVIRRIPVVVRPSEIIAVIPPG